MSQLTTQAARENAIKQHKDDPFLVLLTLTHPTVEGAIYIARNRQKVVSRGNTYIGYPFDPQLPSDTDDAPSGTINVANVSRRIGKTLQKLVTPPSCLVELVLASSPDLVECDWPGFAFSNASWNTFQVTGTIELPDTWNEPWPNKRLTPRGFPGLFP